MTTQIAPLIRGTKGEHVHTADVLRSIAKRVRALCMPQEGRGGAYAGIKSRADDLANQIEARAMAVGLASLGVPDMQRQAEAKVREIVGP